MTPHTGSHGINSLELPDMIPEGPVDSQTLNLQILQIYHELFQDQLPQGNVSPSQPEPQTAQQILQIYHELFHEQPPQGNASPPSQPEPQTVQQIYHGLFQDQLPQVSAPPPSQPEPQAGQQFLQIYHGLFQDQLPQGNAPPPSQPEPQAGQQTLQVYHGLFQDQLPQGDAPPPSQPEPQAGQQLFLGGEDPSGALDPSEHDMLRNQPVNYLLAGQDPSGVHNPSDVIMSRDQPAPPPYSAQVEVSLVKGDIGLGPQHNPPEFVSPPPVQDEVAGHNAPADSSQCPCPICGRIFGRSQERNRHLRTFLPHWIHCPFSRSNCAYRCDRRDNLASHWRKKHADSGQVLPSQQQQYEIYNPEPLVALVVSGQMSMDEAKDIALSLVETRAQELGKGDVWARNWWGRRLKPHTDQR